MVVFLKSMSFIFMLAAVSTLLPRWGKGRIDDGTNKWRSLLGGMLKTQIFKKFILKEDNKSYKSLSSLVQNAGNPLGITVNEWFAIKMLLPLFTMAIFLFQKISLSIFGIKPILGILTFILGILSYFVPDLLLSYVKLIRHKQIMSDVQQFIGTFQSCMDAKALIEDAITSASRSTKVLRPYFQGAINNWSAGPHLALQEIADQLHHDEVVILIGTIQDAVETSPEETQDFFLLHSETIERLKKADSKAWNQIRPLIYSASVFLPFCVSCIIMIWPTYQRVIENMPRLTNFH